MVFVSQVQRPFGIPFSLCAKKFLWGKNHFIKKIATKPPQFFQNFNYFLMHRYGIICACIMGRYGIGHISLHICAKAKAKRGGTA